MNVETSFLYDLLKSWCLDHADLTLTDVVRLYSHLSMTLQVRRSAALWEPEKCSRSPACRLFLGSQPSGCSEKRRCPINELDRSADSRDPVQRVQ